jgi:hypothetical protein
MEVIKQGFEVYTLTGGGYNKRHVHGYAWTKDEAHAIGKATKNHFYVGAVHLIKINGRWHRISVLPIEINGDSSTAPISRIELNDLPIRFTPAIFVQLRGAKPLKLALDLEKAINTIAELPRTKEPCKLYTLRTGGNLPLSFTVKDLHHDEATQQKVFAWLKHEIDFRKAQGETE